MVTSAAIPEAPLPFKTWIRRCFFLLTFGVGNSDELDRPDVGTELDADAVVRLPPERTATPRERFPLKPPLNSTAPSATTTMATTRSMVLM
jgi:hypothetical protein